MYLFLLEILLIYCIISKILFTFISTMEQTSTQSKNQVCSVTWKKFEISQDDLEFYKKVSPKLWWETFAVPHPTLSPEERQRRRMAFRNERNLYRRMCDASWKQIISMYSPDKNFKVFDQSIRRSDQRSALDYGQDFDFSKTFHQNFAHLFGSVPKPSLYNFFADNSAYCNCANYQKDCYLTFASSSNENSMYSHYLLTSKTCVDCYMVFDSEYVYMWVDCQKLYNVSFASNTKSSSQSYFLTNCINCTNCFDCFWLENASFCITNVQYSEQDYKNRLPALLKEKKLYQQKWEMRLQGSTIEQSENVSGAHIRSSKNAHNCFDVGNIQDSKYCTRLVDSRSCYDVYSRWQNSELCYESVAVWDNVHSLAFCANVDTWARNCFYSMHCASSHDLFWCVWLRNTEYCIFNKQYTKEEYEVLAKKIIWHMMETWEWWEFFHPSLSPFGYNETIAQEYYPLEQTDTLIQSWKYNWSGYESPQPVSDRVIDASTISTDIDTMSDEILSYAIKCSQTGKLFRIQKQELDFYRKNKLSLPRVHPDVRHTQRVNLRK